MLALLLRILSLGAVGLLTKITARSVDPYFMGFAIGVSLLVITIPFMVFGKSEIPSGRVIVVPFIIGALLAVSYITFAMSLRTLGLGFVEVMSHVYIPVIILISWAFLGESISWRQWIAFGLVIVGVSLLLGSH